MTEPKPAETVEQPPLILLVDDIPENIQILHQILSTEHYSFAIASSGKETFAVLEKKLPDLILLDIMLDDMDGFEICRRLKEEPVTAEVPVIFLTARVRLEDKVRGFKLGAVDYITKPFEEAEVVARVRSHVYSKRANDTIKMYNRQLEDYNRELAGKNKQIFQQKQELEENVQKLEESYQELHRSQQEVIELEKRNAIMAMAVTTNHELNQPLTVMQGYLELLRQSLPEESLSPQQIKYLERIQGGFGRMVAIMDKFRKSPSSHIEEYVKNKQMVIFDPEEPGQEE